MKFFEWVYKCFGLDSKLVYVDFDSCVMLMILSLLLVVIDIVIDVECVNLLKKESQELVILFEDLFVM